MKENAYNRDLINWNLLSSVINRKTRGKKKKEERREKLFFLLRVKKNHTFDAINKSGE